MKELAEAIEAVHDMIEINGWIQGRFSDGRGGCCLEGAMNRALDTNVRAQVRGHLVDQIKARGDVVIAEVPDADFPNDYRSAVALGTNGQAFSPVPYFNDVVLKSKAQVLEFLDKARIAAEEKA